jgi:hypothetical protein
MPDVHAKLFSPSKAEGWFLCPGRPVMEAPFPDKGNESSDNGTARHAVCAYVLQRPHANVADFAGEAIVWWSHPESESRGVDPLSHFGDIPDPLLEFGQQIVYDPDWVAEDQDYVDTIRKLADGADLFVEQRVDFGAYTDQRESFGTADAVILKQLAGGSYELIVADRKTGYHEVPVERNKQLMMYALGAYDEHSLVYEISRVRLIIHQRAAREWDCAVSELLAFGTEVRSRAISVVNAVAMHGQVVQAEWERTFLNQDPSESACAYCKAMATCPSMQRKVQDVVGLDFEFMPGTQQVPEGVAVQTPEYLAQAMAACGMIEDWIKAVRSEVERRLLAGQQVPGFKLVLGKAGARQWTDAAAAEKMIRETFRVPVEKAYDLKLISPTTAEKLHKAGDIGPRQWPKLQPLIGRADPKPSVAPESDKRDAYVPPNVADDFNTVADAADLC